MVTDICFQFNLETPDTDTFRDSLRIYRSVSATPFLPPFELQVLLAVPDLTTNQVLVYLGADSPRLRIEPTPKFILLESWSLIFSQQQREDNDLDLAPSTIYKHGIGLFRSLYTLLRVLPTWKLHKRLRRRTISGMHRNGHLSIELRVRTSSHLEAAGVLEFGEQVALDS